MNRDRFGHLGDDVTLIGKLREEVQLGLFALAYDERRRLLFACANGLDRGAMPLAFVVAMDPSTGEKRASFRLPGAAFCSEVTYDAAGNLFIFDSMNGRIFQIAAEGALEEGPVQWAAL